MSWLQYLLIAVLLAGMAALVLYRARVQAGARDFVTFIGEVKGEVIKIHWPTMEELRKATMVILVFVTVVALIIGAMDIILQWLLVQLPAGL